MANFIISYDLNGPRPSHKQVDELLEGLGATRARILETVWYVGWRGSYDDLFGHVDGIMSNNDSLIVVEAADGMWRNLLVDDQELVTSWRQNS